MDKKMDVLNTITSSLEQTVMGLNALKEMLSEEKMFAKNIDKLDSMAASIKFDGSNLPTLEGEVLNDALTETTSAYAGKGFLRYVMRMMFNALDYESDESLSYYGKRVNPNGYDAWMRHHFSSYRSQFNALVGNSESYGGNSGILKRMMAKQREKDPTLKFYEIAWSKEKICRILDDYKKDAIKYLDYVSHRRTKNVSYIRTCCRFYDDLCVEAKEDGSGFDLKKLENVFRNEIELLKENIMHAENYAAVRIYLKAFLAQRYIPIRGHAIINKSFADSYKLFGAYWTLQNLIGWHDCCFEGMSRHDSMKHLDEVIMNLEGYQALAMLKKFIKDNSYDFKNDKYIIEFYRKKHCA